jgi:hypothetical protein
MIYNTNGNYSNKKEKISGAFKVKMSQLRTNDFKICGMYVEK